MTDDDDDDSDDLTPWSEVHHDLRAIVLAHIDVLIAECVVEGGIARAEAKLMVAMQMQRVAALGQATGQSPEAVAAFGQTFGSIGTLGQNFEGYTIKALEAAKKILAGAESDWSSIDSRLQSAVRTQLLTKAWTCMAKYARVSAITVLTTDALAETPWGDLAAGAGDGVGVVASSIADALFSAVGELGGEP